MKYLLSLLFISLLLLATFADNSQSQGLSADVIGGGSGVVAAIAGDSDSTDEGDNGGDSSNSGESSASGDNSGDGDDDGGN
jgi:hypothetical protein